VKPKAATVAFFAARLKALPDLEVSTETTVVDRVAASFVYEGTHEGLYYGVAPTPALVHLLRHFPRGRWKDRRAPGHGRRRGGAAQGVTLAARRAGASDRLASAMGESGQEFPITEKSSPGGHSLPSAHFFPCVRPAGAFL